MRWKIIGYIDNDSLTDEDKFLDCFSEDVILAEQHSDTLLLFKKK